MRPYRRWSITRPADCANRNQVDVDHLLPLVDWHPVRFLGPRHAGIVDQDVHPAVGGNRGIDNRVHLRRTRHVADVAFGAEAASAKRLDCGVEPPLAACAQHERRACLSQPLGNLQPEPARAACHDGDAAGEIEELVERWAHRACAILPAGR
jgi:hypothetical protein